MDIDLKRALVRGAEIHYREAGDGEPLILVHGSLGDYRSWSLQMRVFAQRFRTISYSRRYHYPNAWTGDGSDYSASLHADDLSALLDFLRIDRARIVSASYGSYCALVFAQRQPGRIESLVVAEPPMLRWLDRLPGGRELVQGFLDHAFDPTRDAFLHGRDEQAVRLFIDGVVGRTGAFDSLHPPIRRMLMDNAPEMKAECLSDRLFPDFGCDEAAGIEAPVLLLTGERSPAFFGRITEELARCLPNGRVEQIAGASHNLNSSSPRVYNRLVMRFLESAGHQAARV